MSTHARVMHRLLNFILDQKSQILV